MSISYLSESTRKIRRSLLLVSLIGYAISKIGLTLTGIQVFGSKFEMQNYTAIPIVLIMVVTYFLITFVVYSLSEYTEGYRDTRLEYYDKVKEGKYYSPSEIEKNINSIGSQIEELDQLRSEIPIRQGAEHGKRFDDLGAAIEAKRADLRGLKRIHDLIESESFQAMGPFYTRLSWRGLRTFMEITLPILISVYVIAHLAFFTEISNPRIDGESDRLIINQPDSIEIAAETPAFMDSTDTISGD